MSSIYKKASELTQKFVASRQALRAKEMSLLPHTGLSDYDLHLSYFEHILYRTVTLVAAAT